MIINTGQMCIANYPVRPRMRDLRCPDWEKNMSLINSTKKNKKKRGKNTAHQDVTFLFHTVINNAQIGIPE